MKNQIPIKFVDWGIANNFGDCIEVNKELKNYPKLCNYVIKHELKHTNKLFSFYDLKHEFKFNIKMILQLFIFTLRRPKTWKEFLPAYMHDKKIIFDINMFISYALLIILSCSLIALFYF